MASHVLRVRALRLVSATCLLLTGLAACDGTAPPARAPAAPPSKVAQVAPQLAHNDGSPELYKVPVGDSPIDGPTDAKVTLVVFSEFQCPFCARVVPTVAKLRAQYGDDLRVVFKHLPLPFHDRALPAALAAEAARVEGRFWPMHDRLFAEAGQLAAADLDRHARAVGLDGARFAARLGEPALKARIDADGKLAESLGVRGTPTFFVNGRRLVGAQPFEAFAKLIDEERARADEKLRAGTARSALYAALIEGGVDKVAAADPSKPVQGGCAMGKAGCGGAAAARPADDPAAAPEVAKVELGDAPVRGPKDAPVTIVVFSDFECPFCQRIEPTLAQLEQAYPGKIRIAWKNFPLPFHAQARPAARLAVAAHKTGKFWAMHDKLFANQAALDGARLAGLGRELGVAAPAGDDSAIETDIAQGQALGVTGTPTSFINGRRVAGAHPFETFRAMVEQELATKK